MSRVYEWTQSSCIMQWLKAPPLESDCTGSNPGSAIYQMRQLGQVTESLCASRVITRVK